MMSEAKRGLALVGGAAALVLAITCMGGVAGSATDTTMTPLANGPSSPTPAPPPTASEQPAPAPETVIELPPEPDLGGGAGGGMG